MYYPLTATPFTRNGSYRELMPCKALQPYIRCYWGTEEPRMQEEGKPVSKLVIPDTCADIIYDIDDTANTVSGGFCGINDRSFYALSGENAGHTVTTFAIRFYAWSAYVFAGDSLRSTLNGYCEADSVFERLDRMLRPNLLELKSLQEKAAFTEKLCLRVYLIEGEIRLLTM